MTDKVGDMPVNRTQSQYARLMELDLKIRQGGYPNCLTFAEAWGVSQKTVQRDIDFLRDQLGAPIVYDRERKGFFYENSSWWLPSVVLSEGELMGVLLAARVAWANADNALQVHGGNGCALESPISRVLCDARILSVFEGAAEIQANIVIRGLLGS